MISIKFPDCELNKVRCGKSFYVLKPILKRKYIIDFKTNDVLYCKNKGIKLLVLYSRTFPNMVEALKNTEFSIFNVGDSKEKVMDYYKHLYSNCNSQKWIVVFLKLKEIIDN